MAGVDLGGTAINNNAFLHEGEQFLIEELYE
jgi:hypothetical protein